MKFQNAISSSSAKTQRSSAARHSTVYLTLVSMVLAAAVFFVARLLVVLVNLFTNISFYGNFSTHPHPFANSQVSSPAYNHLGLWVIAIPVIGGVIVGLMARYGSAAIRGHGIPEVIEQILKNRSKIPARITILKPISAAVSIGTGGPFGAEGPIIATGSALGSLVGQIFSVTGSERKILLAAGAAAGMTAIFGSPIAAVLLAVELLLFEFQARSLIPVGLACTVAAALRIWLEGTEPIFAISGAAPLTAISIGAYILLGIIVGIAAILISRAVYGIEDAFERLPIHWMWWPALGGVVVGVVGYFAPRTLGVGYDNIRDILNQQFTIRAVLFLCGMKLISWLIALGSGTSGGTLAPILTIGAGLGALCGAGFQTLFPSAGVDVGMAAVVGMAAIFAGASRALFTSVIFAYETTLCPHALLPLLGGSVAAYLVSHLFMRTTIMSEKIVRRGQAVPEEFAPDPFQRVAVGEVMTKNPPLLPATMAVSELARRIELGETKYTRHQAILVVSDTRRLAGIITRGDLMRAMNNGENAPQSVLDAGTSQPLIVTHADEPLSDAIFKMLQNNIGRLPVVERESPDIIVGYLGRANILSAKLKLHHEETVREPGWLKTRGNR